MHAHRFDAQVQAPIHLRRFGLGQAMASEQAEEGGTEDWGFHALRF
jgi:hypothetical protein